VQRHRPAMIRSFDIAKPQSTARRHKQAFIVDPRKLKVVARSPRKLFRLIRQSSVISHRLFQINFPGVRQAQNVILSPRLFLDANRYAEQRPVQQGPHTRDNDSRAIRENKTDQQGSSSTTEKQRNEAVRTTTTCDFWTQAASDP
jgi:hypothetical protein